MNVPSLKKTHPQKYYFKIICSVMYYLGLGNLWYEKTEGSYYGKKLYKVWAVVSNCYVLLGLFDELLAYVRTDLTEKEKNDLQILCFAHPTIYCKILALYIYRDHIKVVIKRLLEGSNSIFYSKDLEKECLRQFARHCIALLCTSYMTLGSASIEGIMTHLNKDIPIRTEVVYYPNPSQTGFMINVLRFFNEFHWYYIVAMMAASDCLALCSLIIVGHKFRLIRLYFQNLRIKTLENKEKKTMSEFEEEFKKDFVVGIKMHEDALWCARSVQNSMGPLYSIQVLEGVGLLVLCLIKVVVAERNFIFLISSFAFIICLIILTGSYMMAAGDITYEASLVGTSIFHSGWEMFRGRSDLRVLAVVAIQMSQVPVYMTAFGVITLSHTNFISVLRSSYSFFAVMY